MRVSTGATRLREDAIERAIVEVLGEDALDEYPDLPYALDELLAQEDDRDLLIELAEGASRLRNAEDILDRERHEDDRSYRERTDVERAVNDVAVDARDALDAYVEERVEDRIEDAVEWLGGDVSLDDLDADEEVEDR
jgi:hypothetical protein